MEDGSVTQHCREPNCSCTGAALLSCCTCQALFHPQCATSVALETGAGETAVYFPDQAVGNCLDCYCKAHAVSRSAPLQTPGVAALVADKNDHAGGTQTGAHNEQAVRLNKASCRSM
jgi:hypothetical protein